MGKCLWCKRALPIGAEKWCSKRCRQAAWKARRNFALQGILVAGGERRPHALSETRTMVLKYADPPYPVKSHLYRGHQDYAGEVDYVRLLDRLKTADGWALSTSTRGVRDLFHLCQDDAVLCSWTKTRGITRTRGPSNVHEYLIVKPARRLFPGVRDVLVAAHARGGGHDLIGRKPPAFWAWLFALLGAQPCDVFNDMFPGTREGSRQWSEFCRSLKAVDEEVS